MNADLVITKVLEPGDQLDMKGYYRIHNLSKNEEGTCQLMQPPALFIVTMPIGPDEFKDVDLFGNRESLVINSGQTALRVIWFWGPEKQGGSE